MERNPSARSRDISRPPPPVAVASFNAEITTLTQVE